MQSGLYPIIKRIRRPLLPIDQPKEATPDAVADTNGSKTVTTDAAADAADEKKTDASDSNK
jgi:hypothetical protein